MCWWSTHHQDAAEALALLLNFNGADAKFALDANHMLEVVREFNPVLMLLDLGLPGVDGFEACRLIRALKGSDIYIAALSGWSSAKDRLRCHEAGFNVNLTKPVGVEGLARLADLATHGDPTRMARQQFPAGN